MGYISSLAMATSQAYHGTLQFTPPAIDASGKRRRGAAPRSCAECRRLKLRCTRVFPCVSCVKRGCGAICPEGSLTTGQGNRFVLASTEELHDKIQTLSYRVRALEDGLRDSHAKNSHGCHPLLDESLLAIKAPLQRELRRSSEDEASPPLSVLDWSDFADSEADQTVGNAHHHGSQAAYGQSGLLTPPLTTGTNGQPPVSSLSTLSPLPLVGSEPLPYAIGSGRYQPYAAPAARRTPYLHPVHRSHSTPVRSSLFEQDPLAYPPSYPSSSSSSSSSSQAPFVNDGSKYGGYVTTTGPMQRQSRQSAAFVADPWSLPHDAPY